MPTKKPIKIINKNAPKTKSSPKAVPSPLLEKAKTNQYFVNGKYVSATGRRKQAVARVKLWAKKGSIIINNQPAEKFFPQPVHQVMYQEPLRVTNTLGKVTLRISVKGSGVSGQVGAIVHGISRALVLLDEVKHKPILKKQGFLTRDSRVKERRKVGTGGKARHQKQSPKR